VPLEELRVVVDHHDRNASGLDLVTRILQRAVGPLGDEQHVGFQRDDLFGAEGALVGVPDIGHRLQVRNHRGVALEDGRPPSLPGSAGHTHHLAPGLLAGHGGELLIVEIDHHPLHGRGEPDLASEGVGHFDRRAPCGHDQQRGEKKQGGAKSVRQRME